MKKMEESKPIDRPFHVRLVDADGSRGFTAGYNTVEEAEKSAADRNARAEELGIKARYAAVPKA